MKIEKIIFATGNEGKMREVRMILSDLGVEVLSLKEAGIEAHAEENGKTFEENAVIKASEIMRQCGEIVLADDSGLEVDALNKEPGIYSARYMGYDTSYHVKNQNLIDRLEGKKGSERSARFVCAMRQHCRTGAYGLQEEPWKVRSAMRSGERTVSAMIPFSISRNMAVIPESFRWRSKTNSVTGGRR